MHVLLRSIMSPNSRINNHTRLEPPVITIKWSLYDSLWEKCISSHRGNQTLYKPLLVTTDFIATRPSKSNEVGNTLPSIMRNDVTKSRNTKKLIRSNQETTNICKVYHHLQSAFWFTFYFYDQIWERFQPQFIFTILYFWNELSLRTQCRRRFPSCFEKVT